MRKYLFLVLIVPLFALVLASCGDDDSSPHGERAADGMGMGDEGMHMGGHSEEENSPVAPDAREVSVAGTSFSFDPDEIEARVGEDLVIVLTSDDILHDFTIDELDAHVSAEEGETAQGGLRADEAGEYVFYCSVSGHREEGMEGTLVVS